MALIDEAGFKESEHPRGNPENAGQFTSSGGGGKKGSIEKGTGRGSKPQPDFRGSLARVSEGDTTQPVKSLDELYERAKKEEPEFKRQMSDIASKYGSEVSYTPEEYAEPGTILKSRSSAERKLAKELDNDPTLLRDVIRATIIGKSVADTRKAAAAFIGENSDSILRVKDRYTDPLKGGYRDILINYRTPDGLVAEVQFNSKNMVDTKNGTAHKLYEVARSLINPTFEQMQKLEQQQAELYESAYQMDGNGNGWKHGQHDAASQEEGEVVRRYKLSKELSKDERQEFEAVIVKGNDQGLSVYTNVEGSWKPSKINFADLIMPEQNLSDWEVTPVEESAYDDGDQKDNFDGGATLRAIDGIKRRTVDRKSTRDFEYYTSESIGPNRSRTPEGFLICYDVPAARIGEMTYAPMEVPRELGSGKDGKVRVTRAASEVFDRRSLSSLNGKPVTDDHPPVDVDPRNWKHYTKGVVANPRRGDTPETRDFVIVDMIIYDEDLIEDIDSGKREVSCGYNPEYLQVLDDKTGEPIPGRGEQVRIRYNHLALVKAGRCGPFCAVGDRRTVDEEVVSQTETFFTPERARLMHRALRRLRSKYR